jgi:hypothetical protein
VRSLSVQYRLEHDHPDSTCGAHPR